jgi:hypothetical protein
VTGVRQELAEARGTARSVLATAESARGEAQRRKMLVRDAYATCLAQLAEAREYARRDIVRRFTDESTSLSASVESLAAHCSAGAAGAPWRSWEPGEPDRTSSSGLLRIGSIAYEHSTLPALLPVLDTAHLVLTGDQDTADGVITGLLLRALGTTRAGDLRLSVYDPEHLGGALAAFGPLGNAGLMSFVSPAGLDLMLDDLVDHICRINESVLAGEFTSLAQLTAAASGPRAEPWRLLVLLIDRISAGEITPGQRAQLDRIVRTGVACGVHLLVRGLELEPHPTVQRLAVAGDGSATAESTGDLRITLDEPPPPDRIAAFCRTTAERLQDGLGPAQLSDLEPRRLWIESSAHGLIAPIGDGPDGALVMVPLGDDPPHALIGGPSGSGKTNLISAWLGSLAARYGPAELTLYLLDFGTSGSFARCTPGPREPSWLPQLRLAGVNLADDPEFGLAVLRSLAGELQLRAQAAKRHEATRLAELRAEDPDGHWPRIVVILDEFPVLLAGEAADLLEDLARRGQTLGIHLVLVTQDVAGLDALHGRAALIEHFALRIALPKARRVLADNNLAAALIPRHHAVLNTDSGVAGANQVVRLPDAADRIAWRDLQRKLWRERPPGATAPRLFDGDEVPWLPVACRTAGTATQTSAPEAVLGERIDVTAQPARLRLSRAPGRNLAVLGTRVDEACDVLAAAALSLAAQGPARFSVACLDPAAESAVGRLVADLPQADWYGPDEMAEMFGALRPDSVPHYVLGYAFDALPACHDQLRTLLTTGPELRMHVLGWWRTVTALRDDLGGPQARTDPIGAWVALDVTDAELGPLAPQADGPPWRARRRRARYYDRSVHRTPEVIIPYEVKQ